MSFLALVTTDNCNCVFTDSVEDDIIWVEAGEEGRVIAILGILVQVSREGTEGEYRSLTFL